MPELGPLYLIHGDDHAAIAARRANLRALAESSSDGGGVELLEGPDATPAGAALALASMTLAMGRRVVIVDGAERWKGPDVEEHLAPALAQIPPDTTLALFAREEQRGHRQGVGAAGMDARAGRQAGSCAGQPGLQSARRAGRRPSPADPARAREAGARHRRPGPRILAPEARQR
jgi:hypothetical protein